MKLFVVLAGLLTHFADPTAQRAREVLLLGDALGAHQTQMLLVPAGYPPDGHEVWELDADEVVVNPNQTTGDTADLQLGAAAPRWLRLTDILGATPVIRSACLGANRFRDCRIGAMRLLRASVLLDGNYELRPLEVDEDGMPLPPAGQPIYYSVLRDPVTGRETRKGPYAGATLAASTATFSPMTPPVVTVNGFEIRLAPSSDTACQLFDPTHTTGGCYILRFRNFIPGHDDEEEKDEVEGDDEDDFNPVDLDFGTIYDLLQNPPADRVIPVVTSRPRTSEPTSGSTNPPETRCSGAPF